MIAAPLLPGISLEGIKHMVAAHYGLEPEALSSPARIRKISWPRQMAMSLAREYTRHSQTMIGGRFGGLDHSSVFYAHQAVQARTAAKRDIREDREALRAQLDRLRIADLADCARNVEPPVISAIAWTDGPEAHSAEENA